METIFRRAVLLLAVASPVMAGLAWVDLALHPLAPEYVFHSALYRAVVALVFMPLSYLVGLLIIRRVPGNLVGPLFLAWSASVTLGSVRWDMPQVLRAVFSFFDYFGWMALFTMLLHFPDGKIYPARVAPWIYRLLVVVMLLIGLMFFSSSAIAGSPGVLNPFYLPSLEKAAGLILNLGILFILPIIVMGLVSPVLRYRQAGPRERQQIKWLALFAGFSVLYTLLGLVVYPLFTGGEMMNPGSSLSAAFFYVIVSLFPPLAIGLAVLRHRLWDIDIIIRRTLIYGVLTAALALVYFGLVAVLQAFFSSISNQQSPIINVLSTLAIAALFTPLRRGIQNLIDRRFYRQKYNAERVLADFSAALRDEVELDHLKGSILSVVEETVHPAYTSLWLRETVAPKRLGEK